MNKHLIFFDASCRFCSNAVDRVMRWDKKEIFLSAPLDGDLAKAMKIERDDSFILVENFYGGKKKIYLRGRGVARVFWLLGGWWKWLGWLCFFPFGLNLFYTIVARHRHRFKR